MYEEGNIIKTFFCVKEKRIKIFLICSACGFENHKTLCYNRI